MLIKLCKLNTVFLIWRRENGRENKIITMSITNMEMLVPFRDWSTKIKHKTFSKEEIAIAMWERFNDISDDNNEGLSEKYQEEWTVEKLEKMIDESLEKSEKNYKQIKAKIFTSNGYCF